MTFRRLLETDIHAASVALLGMDLVRGELRARIVETEAYVGDGDPGCHAFRGKTPRNAPLFEEPGRAYVYFTYGAHWMLNITALPPGTAGAILIRAARPLAGIEQMRERRPRARSDRDLLSGPGKLAAGFGIDASQNRADLLDPAGELRIEPGKLAQKILVGRRIGLAPGKGDDLDWRYVDAEEKEWRSAPSAALSGLFMPQRHH